MISLAAYRSPICHMSNFPTFDKGRDARHEANATPWKTRVFGRMRYLDISLGLNHWPEKVSNFPTACFKGQIKNSERSQIVVDLG